jgi:hypothetical protein
VNTTYARATFPPTALLSSSSYPIENFALKDQRPYSPPTLAGGAGLATRMASIMPKVSYFQVSLAGKWRLRRRSSQ